MRRIQWVHAYIIYWATSAERGALFFCLSQGTTLYIQFYGYNNGTTSPTISVTAATPNLYVLVVATDGTGLTSTVTAA